MNATAMIAKLWRWWRYAFMAVVVGTFVFAFAVVLWAVISHLPWWGSVLAVFLIGGFLNVIEHAS